MHPPFEAGHSQKCLFRFYALKQKAAAGLRLCFEHELPRRIDGRKPAVKD
jgi:hypothetical protein